MRTGGDADDGSKEKGYSLRCGAKTTCQSHMAKHIRPRTPPPYAHKHSLRLPPRPQEATNRTARTRAGRPPQGPAGRPGPSRPPPGILGRPRPSSPAGSSPHDCSCGWTRRYHRHRPRPLHNGRSLLRLHRLLTRASPGGRRRWGGAAIRTRVGVTAIPRGIT
jgi:hypothetical protein